MLPAEILQQVSRITRSRWFASSKRLPNFLNYVVGQTLEDKGKNIKQYSIAVDVYDRPSSFDPKADPIVRIEAGRLRRALRKYYQVDGQNDDIMVDIPLGTYVPTFEYLNEDQGASHKALPTTVKSDELISSPVVAVFPFVNRGKDEFNFLTNGLGEELTAELSRCMDLDVIAFNSTARISESSQNTVVNASYLGANFAISGTIRNSGSRIRISVHLIDVDNEKQIWAEKFDADFVPENIFQIEDELISQILARVSDSYGAISREMCSRADSYRVSEPSVYLSILRYLDYQLTLDPNTFHKCISELESATEIAPKTATVWAMLSQMFLDSFVFCYGDIPDAREKALLYANRAVTLDRQCQHAQHAMAYACMINHDRDGLIDATKNMLGINPKSAFMQGAGSFWYCVAGEHEKGMELFANCYRLNPFLPSWLHAGPFFSFPRKKEFDQALFHAKEFHHQFLVKYQNMHYQGCGTETLLHEHLLLLLLK